MRFQVGDIVKVTKSLKETSKRLGEGRIEDIDFGRTYPVRVTWQTGGSGVWSEEKLRLVRRPE